MSKEFSANIHDPNHTADEYDIYFNGDIISGSGEHEFSANIHDPNHTDKEYDIYFNGELIESGGGKSDMDGWTDGMPYTDIEIVENEYVNKDNGSFQPYTGWNRTGYVPINGASNLSIPKLSGTGGNTRYNAFYTSDHTWISNFDVSHGAGVETVNVPETAYYFVISERSDILTYWLEEGVIPNA